MVVCRVLRDKKSDIRVRIYFVKLIVFIDFIYLLKTFQFIELLVR